MPLWMILIVGGAVLAMVLAGLGSSLVWIGVLVLIAGAALTLVGPTGGTTS